MTSRAKRKGKALRTTLSIDDDILAAAKFLAAREKKTLGAVISSPARQGLVLSRKNTNPVRNGIALLLNREGAVPATLGLVNRLRDEQP